jgi:E3 ubiquitin-protein ligase HERC1
MTCIFGCRGKKCKPIFTQIAQQVIKLNPAELRLPARAWKVKLIGEGADDAGGVFDDTITEMCQVFNLFSCSS